MESNNAVVFDHMILYISCSVGSWTASISHNNDNMFHMNPTPHYCQRLATNTIPAAQICKVYHLTGNGLEPIKTGQDNINNVKAIYCLL